MIVFWPGSGRTDQDVARKDIRAEATFNLSKRSAAKAGKRTVGRSTARGEDARATRGEDVVGPAEAGQGVICGIAENHHGSLRILQDARYVRNRHIVDGVILRSE